MQNASLLPVPELTPAAEYIPLSPLSYEVAEEYAMGMLSALQGTAALGAGLHIAGSLLIVYGQTLVKVHVHGFHFVAACMDPLQTTQNCSKLLRYKVCLAPARCAPICFDMAAAGCSAHGGDI